MSCWRRLRDWQEAGVWARPHQVLLERLQAAGEIDWSRASRDSASVPAKKELCHRPEPDGPEQAEHEAPPRHRRALCSMGTTQRRGSCARPARTRIPPGGEGDSPLRWCVEDGNHDFARLLLAGGTCRTMNRPGGFEGRTALGMAVNRLDVAMVDLLPEAGADPDAPDLDGRCAVESLPPVDRCARRQNRDCPRSDREAVTERVLRRERNVRALGDAGRIRRARRARQESGLRAGAPAGQKPAVVSWCRGRGRTLALSSVAGAPLTHPCPEARPDPEPSP